MNKLTQKESSNVRSNLSEIVYLIATSPQSPDTDRISDRIGEIEQTLFGRETIPDIRADAFRASLDRASSERWTIPDRVQSVTKKQSDRISQIRDAFRECADLLDVPEIRQSIGFNPLYNRFISDAYRACDIVCRARDDIENDARNTDAFNRVRRIA